MLELKIGLIRALGLFLPLTIAIVVIMIKKSSYHIQDFAGMTLSFFWCVTTLLIFNAIIPHFGAWSFNAQGGLFYGVPVDIILGWGVFWGVLPLLVLPDKGKFFNKDYFAIPLTAAILFALEWLVMPLMAPVVELHGNWMLFDIGLLVMVMSPALLLARWTHQQSHLTARAVFQVILFSLIFLVLIPAIVLEQTSADGGFTFSLPYWQLQLAGQTIILFAVIGVSAVQEFKERGNGTPFPWDPPQSLVTTGLYAYVTNPMQVSMVLIYPVLGFLLKNTWVVLSGLMVVVFFYGIARWYQDQSLTKRFGDSWHLYRKNVRPWFPRWRPWMPPANEQAVVYFDIEGCSFCRDLAAWYSNQHPSGIAVMDARKHPDRDLFRMVYRSPDNEFEEEGIVALGRILGHINLAWAFIGCVMRLPVISKLIELFADHFLVKPHWVRREQ